MKKQKRRSGPRPRLSVTRVLKWADEYRRRAGRWPHHKSGRIRGEPGENWNAVDAALTNGNRGLDGGSSLAKLLADRRGKRNHLNLPRLSIGQILAWADAHRKRSGEWPMDTSGPVHGARSEKWSAISRALYKGNRGLRTDRVTLAQLLAKRRDVRNASKVSLARRDG
jgi:hypothetical protein